MTSQKQQLNEQKMINHLSTVGILGNVILTAFKLLAGIIGHSGAMISDAVHSLSDVFATFIAFLGVKLSKKSADSEHPYGHDRLATLQYGENRLRYFSNIFLSIFL